MYKIDSLYSVDRHFYDGDYRTGRKGTLAPALWLNALQGEICNYITNSGISLDKEDDSQMLKALNRNLGRDLQKQTISGSANRIDHDVSILTEFSVPPGGVIDLTVMVKIPGSVDPITVALKVVNGDDSIVYKTVYFRSRVDDSRGCRRICLKNNSGDSEYYKVEVNCSENVFIVGSVELNGWADSSEDTEVGNA